MSRAVLADLEALLSERLTLLKQFSAHCADALRALDEEDADAFAENIEAGDALTLEMDVLSKAIEETIPLLGAPYAATVQSLFASGGAGASVPAWSENLASCRATTEKLLLSCLNMNERMESRARALMGQIREQIARIRASQKLRNSYLAPGGTTGTHINYTLK